MRHDDGGHSPFSSDSESLSLDSLTVNDSAPASPARSPLKQRPPLLFSSTTGLLSNNRAWANEKRARCPAFFASLAQGQQPNILWIGCSDSRVPPTDILRLGPGDAFVHRNIANIVSLTDLSFLSVLQYAVDVLKVKHVVVCGHYSCGGVIAAMGTKRYGVIDSWLQQVRDVHREHRRQVDALPTFQAQSELLCELNVLNSLGRVATSTVILDAWQRGQNLSLHGWCFRLSDGVIRDMGLDLDGRQGDGDAINAIVRNAMRTRTSVAL